MFIAAVLASLAIVTQDQSALRAAPKDSAQQQAVLLQGEVLEVRGQRLDYLQVYDHRLERAGYVRAAQVRSMSLSAAEAPALLSVVRFLEDSPGQEALGIAYAAAYLKAAPADAIDAEPFEAIGIMADRLAQRASARQGKASDPALASALEVVASYGVALQSFERDGRVQVCYDGEALRRVLALKSTPDQKARAALALTRHECVGPELTPAARFEVDQWRADVLDRVATGDLDPVLKARLHMRRAGVWASLAFQEARRRSAYQEAAERALDEFAAVSKTDLTDADLATYDETAVRVGASRWAAAPLPAARRPLDVIATPGEPGQTCVALVDARHDADHALAQRCTYGIVWLASAEANASGTQLALAVQLADTWRELWLFRQDEGTWSVEVLPPSPSGPDLGYIELAGWVPGGGQLLAAREALVDGRFRRDFQVLRTDTLEVQHQAGDPHILAAFQRWSSAAWKHDSISLR